MVERLDEGVHRLELASSQGQGTSRSERSWGAVSAWNGRRSSLFGDREMGWLVLGFRDYPWLGCLVSMGVKS